MSYKTILTTEYSNHTETEYNNHTLDEVRALFIADLKSKGYYVDTPIVGWNEIGIDSDGVKQMRFVYEHYHLVSDDNHYVTAEIRDNDFHI